ncbi:MAG: S41 family peptidase [Thermoanaerobaculum sp.]|nr:S41 family peptidase [Thermoanaerobaculum sp.]
MRRTLVVLALLWAGGVRSEEVRLPRFPAPSPDGQRIVFSWRGDLWVVSAGGGEATRLTADPAYDWGAVWDGDGKALAFASDRQGSDDVLLLSWAEGRTRRLSFHEASDLPQGFLAGNVVFLSRRHEAWNRKPAVYLVPQRGGTEKLLTRVLAQEAVPSPDGRHLALVRGGTPDSRRHYRGSANRDLWLMEVATGKLVQLTRTPWDEDHVSWAGDQALIFRSDQGGEDRNLFRLELADGRTLQLTHHSGGDVRYPKAAARGNLVAYEFGDGLFVVPADGQGKPRRLSINAAVDTLEDDTERVVLRDQASEVVPSPDGTQVALVVRGDVYVIPRRSREIAALAGNVTVRVTSTPGWERDVTWSPDSKALVYASDRFGQYDLFRAEPVSPGNFVKSSAFREVRLTATEVDERHPQFSPDGKLLGYLVGRGDLTVADANAKNPRTLFTHWSSVEFSFSPDGQWLAFSRDDEHFNSDVFIVPVTGGVPVNISQHPDEDVRPTWSPDGRRLYWLSRRHNRTMDLWAVYLTKLDHERTPEGWAALFEEEEKAGKKDDAAKGEARGEAKGKPSVQVRIDFPGIHLRAQPVTNLPGDEGEFVLSPDSRTVVFVAEQDGQQDLFKVRFDGKELKRLTEQGANPSQLSFLKEAKLVVYRGAKGTVESVNLEGKAGDPMRFEALFTVSRKALRAQVFQEAWRELERNFYDPQFHGYDWHRIGQTYRPWAELAWADRDFEQVVNWMLGELNASHMGFRLGENDNGKVGTAALGVEVEPAPDGAGVVVTEVLEETPAAREEVGLKVGDRIVAVNGQPVKPETNFFSLLEGLARQPIRLTVASGTGEREVVVKAATVDAVRQARYRTWVKERRAIVERLSGGKLGYIHIQGMDAPSLEEFQRDLYAAAAGKQGLLIDVRNNGGGWTTDYLMAILNVRRHAWTVPRGMDPSLRGYPQDRLPLPAWTRPAAALCDEASYSNAEIFSWAFKTLKRGPLVGMTTFGAVISTGGARLVDGSFVRLPFRGWFVAGSGINMERQGCEPDYLVVQPPQQDMDKHQDAQLAKAVEVLLAQLPANPQELPW